MKKLTVIFAGMAVVLAVAAWAEQGTGGQGGGQPVGPGRMAQGGTNHPNMRIVIGRKAMQWLKEKDAARHDQIMKLRETDQEAFRAAVAEVVKEYLAANPGERPGQGQDGDRPMILRKAMQWLKEKDAARHDEIMKLRETDKEAFRKAVGEVVKEYLAANPNEKPQGGPGGRGEKPPTPAA